MKFTKAGIVSSRRDLMCACRNVCRPRKGTRPVACPPFKAVESALNVKWKDQQLNLWRHLPLVVCAVDMVDAGEEDSEEFKLSSNEDSRTDRILDPDTGKSWSEDAILEPHRNQIHSTQPLEPRTRLRESKGQVLTLDAFASSQQADLKIQRCLFGHDPSSQPF